MSRTFPAVVMHCRVTRLRLFSRCWKKKIEDKSNDDAFEDEGEEVPS